MDVQGQQEVEDYLSHYEEAVKQADPGIRSWVFKLGNAHWDPVPPTNWPSTVLRGGIMLDDQLRLLEPAHGDRQQIDRLQALRNEFEAQKVNSFSAGVS